MNCFAFLDLVMREGVSCGFGSVSSTERFWNVLLVSKRWQSVMEKYDVQCVRQEFDIVTGFLKV